MNSAPTDSDGIHTPRVASLQPPMLPSDLAGPATAYSDPAANNDMLSILRLWGAERPGLPNDFCDEVAITSIVRQPAALLCAELERIHRALRAVDVPFDGGILNKERWPTQDLFTLTADSHTFVPR